MAIVESPLFTSITQSCGKNKFTKRHDKIIMSAKGSTPTFKDKKVKEKRDLRISGFGGSGHVGKILSEVLALGYRELPAWKTPVNLFMEDNATTLCTSSRDEKKQIVKTYNFLAMKVAGGSLDTVEVTAEYTEETKKFMFSQDGTVIIGGRAFADDQLYACLFEGVQLKVALVELRKRGDSGSTSFALPTGWKVESVTAHVFAVSADEQLSSPSTRAYPAPTEEERAIAIRAQLELSAREEERITRDMMIAEREARLTEAVFRAQEAMAKTKADALAAGKGIAIARIEAQAAHDIVMEEAREAERLLEEQVLIAENRAAAEKEAREKATSDRAKARATQLKEKLAADRKAVSEK